MLNHNTPVELYEVQGRSIWVKREDLSSPPPGPPFSKVRGLVPSLIKLKEEGIETVGYTETSISMAGWGVAWACHHLGMRAVIFDPQYKSTPDLLAYHRKQWGKFSPELIPIKAGMARVNWNISQKILSDRFQRSKLLPLGLTLPETVHFTGEEAQTTGTADLVARGANIVVNVGSGTIAAGLVKAYPESRIIGVMGRTGNITRKMNLIFHKAGIIGKGLFKSKLYLVDPGWSYSQPSRAKCPFPCHPYYDLKAWQWLVENLEDLKDPILFWNIGRVK